MKAESDRNSETKECPLCNQALSLAEFGICRARKDGRNLYCKSCIRKKVTDSRQALREYKSARKRYVSLQSLESSDVSIVDSESHPGAQHIGRLISKLSPIERVREAIRKNARTQKEIAQETKLGKDEIGDALANLLLWSREIRTEVIDNTRMYFINESPEVAFSTAQEEPRIPRRKPDVPSSFSALQGLMPGKKPEGEPEKIGGWVAA
ncbi:MAG TPA: hypothetical protein VFD48_13070 [Pyrinomonadaceae bacterium]|nr:hypothetical protein [Pyrinomonadaceae bacterium]